MSEDRYRFDVEDSDALRAISRVAEGMDTMVTSVERLNASLTEYMSTMSAVARKTKDVKFEPIMAKGLTSTQRAAWKEMLKEIQALGPTSADMAQRFHSSMNRIVQAMGAPHRRIADLRQLVKDSIHEDRPTTGSSDILDKEMLTFRRIMLENTKAAAQFTQVWDKGTTEVEWFTFLNEKLQQSGILANASKQELARYNSELVKISRLAASSEMPIGKAMKLIDSDDILFGPLARVRELMRTTFQDAANTSGADKAFLTLQRSVEKTESQLEGVSNVLMNKYTKAMEVANKAATQLGLTEQNMEQIRERMRAGKATGLDTETAQQFVTSGRTKSIEEAYAVFTRMRDAIATSEEALQRLDATARHMTGFKALQQRVAPTTAGSDKELAAYEKSLQAMNAAIGSGRVSVQEMNIALTALETKNFKGVDESALRLAQNLTDSRNKMGLWAKEVFNTSQSAGQAFRVIEDSLGGVLRQAPQFGEKFVLASQQVVNAFTRSGVSVDRFNEIVNRVKKDPLTVSTIPEESPIVANLHKVLAVTAEADAAIKRLNGSAQLLATLELLPTARQLGGEKEVAAFDSKLKQLTLTLNTTKMSTEEVVAALAALNSGDLSNVNKQAYGLVSGVETARAAVEKSISTEQRQRFESYNVLKSLLNVMAHVEAEAPQMAGKAADAVQRVQIAFNKAGLESQKFLLLFQQMLDDKPVNSLDKRVQSLVPSLKALVAVVREAEGIGDATRTRVEKDPGLSAYLEAQRRQRTTFGIFEHGFSPELDRALISLKTITEEQGKGANDVRAAWQDVAKNGIGLATGEAGKLRTAIAKVQEEQKKLSGGVHAVLLSWRSVARIMVANVIRRGMWAIYNNLRSQVQEAIKIQQALAEVQTITQSIGYTNDQWLQKTLEVSDMYGTSLRGNIEALYQTISNQVATGQRALDFLRTASEFGLATASSTEASVDLLSSALNAYNMDVERSTEVSALFFKTIELGRVRANEMKSTLGAITPLASQLNITLEELLNTIATLTVQGMKFNLASTQIRGIMTKLIKPTTGGKDFFRDLGVSSGEAAIAAYGLAGALNELGYSTERNSEEIGKILANIRGLVGGIALLQDGMYRFDRNMERMQTAQADYAKAVELMMENAGRKIEIATTKVKNTLLLLANDFVVSIAEADGVLDTSVTTLREFVKTLYYFKEAAGVAAIAATALALKLHPITGKAVLTATMILAVGNAIRNLDEKARINALTELRETMTNLATGTGRLSKSIGALDKELENTKNNQRGWLQLLAHSNRVYTAFIDSASEKSKEFAIAFERATSTLHDHATESTKAIEDQITALGKMGPELRDTLSNLKKEVEDFAFEIELSTMTQGGQFDAKAQKYQESVKEMQALKEELAALVAQSADTNITDVIDESVLTDAKKRLEELTKKQFAALKDLHKARVDFKAAEDKLLADKADADTKYETGLVEARRDLEKSAAEGDDKSIRNLEQIRRMEEEILRLRERAEKVSGPAVKGGIERQIAAIEARKKAALDSFAPSLREAYNATLASINAEHAKSLAALQEQRDALGSMQVALGGSVEEANKLVTAFEAAADAIDILSDKMEKELNVKFVKSKERDSELARLGKEIGGFKVEDIDTRVSTKSQFDLWNKSMDEQITAVEAYMKIAEESGFEENAILKEKLRWLNEVKSTRAEIYRQEELQRSREQQQDFSKAAVQQVRQQTEAITNLLGAIQKAREAAAVAAKVESPFMRQGSAILAGAPTQFLLPKDERIREKHMEAVVVQLGNERDLIARQIQDLHQQMTTASKDERDRLTKEVAALEVISYENAGLTSEQKDYRTLALKGVELVKGIQTTLELFAGMSADEIKADPVKFGKFVDEIVAFNANLLTYTFDEKSKQAVIDLQKLLRDTKASSTVSALKDLPKLQEAVDAMRDGIVEDTTKTVSLITEILTASRDQLRARALMGTDPATLARIDKSLKPELTRILEEEAAAIVVEMEKKGTTLEDVTEQLKAGEDANLRIEAIGLKRALDGLVSQLALARAAIEAITIGPPVLPTPKSRGGWSYFAGGGQAMGVDYLPAMLSRGEFVMNRFASARFASMLTGMNASRSTVPQQSVNVGDINISLQSSGNTSMDVKNIGHALKREIRRGSLSI